MCDRKYGKILSGIICITCKLFCEICILFNAYFASSQSKYLYFEFLQDSTKARTFCAAAPAAMQSFSLNNSLVTDYVGNTRISLLTGVISAKKDTTLALHSLANGAGNFTVELESPLWLKRTRESNKKDFIGCSIHPRISTVLSNTQTFETSIVSYDLGFNITGRLTGDLGNMSLKYTLRNAICAGNNQFVRKTFGFKNNQFVYSSVQLKIRAGPTIFSLNLPLYIYSFDNILIQNLPVYAGYSLLF